MYSKSFDGKRNRQLCRGATLWYSCWWWYWWLRYWRRKISGRL